MKPTQRQTILALLTQRGRYGVSAHEAIYDMGITRLAAIVFDLRKDGYNIISVDEPDLPNGQKRLQRYVLQKETSTGQQLIGW